MKVFTISQASIYCNVDIDTMTKWIDDGLITTDSAAGGHRRIKQEDLDSFLQSKGMKPAATAPDDGRKRILVVDDDKIVVETIVQSLEEDEHGYDIISASDGFEASQQVKHFKPDLLILDIMMPDINGYDVCKELKSAPETQSTKIVVLSAYLDEENYKKMKEFGADACYSKPLPLDELKKEIAGLLGLQ